MKVFNITKKQIIELSRYDTFVEKFLMEWFPESFENNLIIGNWYKTHTLKFYNEDGLDSKEISSLLLCYSEGTRYTYKGIYCEI